MKTLQLIIHAPTPAALERARRNLANLLKLAPDTQVELVVNGGAAVAALDTPDALDGHLRICQNSLAASQRQAPEGILTVPAAVLHIARRQAEGWGYMRA